MFDFGRELLRTKDLDPVYVVLWKAQLDPALLRRWLLAYWCFYHVGTASWIATGGVDYWPRMRTAAGSKDYPRSSERRHFRGGNARKSVEFLEKTDIEGLFRPIWLVGSFGPNHPTTAARIMEIVQQWVGFGPWIAFKVADMLERLALCPVQFDKVTAMYEAPTAGAVLMWQTLRPNGVMTVSRARDWSVSTLLQELDGELAPPRYERGINIQEVETILCKWKSYMVGHYEVGEDIHACRQGLLRFARCPLSQELLRGGKRGGLW